MGIRVRGLHLFVRGVFRRLTMADTMSHEDLKGGYKTDGYKTSTSPLKYTLWLCNLAMENGHVE